MAKASDCRVPPRQRRPANYTRRAEEGEPRAQTIDRGPEEPRLWAGPGLHELHQCSGRPKTFGAEECAASFTRTRYDRATDSATATHGGSAQCGRRPEATKEKSWRGQ